MSQQDQAPTREVAQRVFAREINDAIHTFRESDDDRAPVYALLPTGAKANRVFVVGTLTETADVGSDDEYWQGRIVDPTGSVFAYAGQYQPDAARLLRQTEPPAFVAIVGKPRTYDTDDGDTYVSLRPEHLTVVDEATRSRWVTETALRTLARLEQYEAESNEYAAMAREQYETTTEPYRQAVIEAVESLDNPPDAPDTTPDGQASAGATKAETDTAGPSRASPEPGSGPDSDQTAPDSGSSTRDDDPGDFTSGDFDSEL